MPSDWSADGQWVLGSCESAPRTRRNLCLLPLAAAPYAERALRIIASDTNRNLYQARFSPDQRWIAFQAMNFSTFSTLYVMPAGGGPWVPISDGNFWDDKPRWSPDGRVLYLRVEPRRLSRCVGSPIRSRRGNNRRSRLSSGSLRQPASPTLVASLDAGDGDFEISWSYRSSTRRAGSGSSKTPTARPVSACFRTNSDRFQPLDKDRPSQRSYDRRHQLSFFFAHRPNLVRRKDQGGVYRPPDHGGRDAQPRLGRRVQIWRAKCFRDLWFC